MTVTAIVPLKALASAKGRLAGVLDSAERQTFTTWMARRVLAACAECAAIDATLVVAGDEAGAAIARSCGASALVVPQPGLAAALAAADAACVDAAMTLVVAADLPEATAEDLQAVVDAAAGPDPVVVIAPTHDGGTGVLLRRPPAVIATAYGLGSASAHAAAARAAGVPTVMVHRRALANDIDTPAQLPAALALVAQSDVGSGPR